MSVWGLCSDNSEYCSIQQATAPVCTEGRGCAHQAAGSLCLVPTVPSLGCRVEGERDGGVGLTWFKHSQEVIYLCIYLFFW
jgi:hypothetical protein